MLDAERQFVDLIFRASKKYASWDPEVVVEVGDYGMITRGKTGLAFWRKTRGIFVKEGNIYKNGLAEKYDIPNPQEHGVDSTEGMSWITSKNAKEVDFATELSAQTPAFVSCRAKAAFKFISGRGAIVAMNNDTIYTIDSPGKFRRLLDEEKIKGLVIVSEVHRCSSYARFLSTEDGATVALGLGVDAPIDTVASANFDAKWVRNSSAGNFKSRVNKTGKRDFYPLFRLVSLTEGNISTGLRGDLDEDPPLPDASPPWELFEGKTAVRSDGYKRKSMTQDISTIFPRHFRS